MHVYFSLQDSMNEACAKGIGDEHYRLEGRLCSLSHIVSLPKTRRVHLTDSFSPLRLKVLISEISCLAFWFR